MTFASAFLTPQSRRPQDVVALAQHSEQAGLDPVTFQDHPYQPALLDAAARGQPRRHPGLGRAPQLFIPPTIE